MSDNLTDLQLQVADLVELQKLRAENEQLRKQIEATTPNTATQETKKPTKATDEREQQKNDFRNKRRASGVYGI